MEYVNKRTGNKIAIVVILVLMVLTVFAWIQGFRFTYSMTLTPLMLEPKFWIEKTTHYATHLTTIAGAIWMSMNILIISFVFEIIFLIANIVRVIKRK